MTHDETEAHFHEETVNQLHEDIRDKAMRMVLDSEVAHELSKPIGLQLVACSREEIAEARRKFVAEAITAHSFSDFPSTFGFVNQLDSEGRNKGVCL